jgi:hypothetical protein
MPSYNPSTQERIADLVCGMRVETGVFDNLTYFHQDQMELFHLYGRVWLKQLFIECITDNGGGATLIQFNYTFTTPAITVKPLSAVTTSIAALVRGSRIVWVGGAVATATVLTVATGGCSDVIADAGAIMGGIGFIGTIGMLTSVANPVSGTSQAVAFYVPMSDGAYMEGNVLPTAPPG